MKKTSYDCFQSVYDWIANEFQIKIFIHYLEKMCFSLTESVNSLTKTHGLIEEYHGIKFSEVNSIENDNMHMVLCDGYDCNWTDMYKKHHSIHAFILNPKALIIIDPFYSRVIKYPTNSLDFLDVRLFEIQKTTPVKDNYLYAVKNIFELALKQRRKNSEIHFIDNIRESIFTEKYGDFRYDPRLVAIKQYNNKFINLHFCFLEISKIHWEFEKFCVLSLQLVKKSTILMDLVFKCYVKNDDTVAELKHLFCELINLEFEMMCIVREWLYNEEKEFHS